MFFGLVLRISYPEKAPHSLIVFPLPVLITSLHNTQIIFSSEYVIHLRENNETRYYLLNKQYPNIIEDIVRHTS